MSRASKGSEHVAAWVPTTPSTCASQHSSQFTIPYHVLCQRAITAAKHTSAGSLEAETKEKTDEGTPETGDPTQRSLHKAPKKSHAYADEWWSLSQIKWWVVILFLLFAGEWSSILKRENVQLNLEGSDSLNRATHVRGSLYKGGNYHWIIVVRRHIYGKQYRFLI